MKSSLFSRSVAYGALFALSIMSFSCDDSGNAGYGQDFYPDTSSSAGVPVANLDAGAGNALDGLAVGQTTLDAATTAVKNGESDAPTPVLNSQFAATAAPAGYNGTNFGGTNSNSGSNPGSTNPGSVAFGGTTTGRTSSAGGGGGSTAGGAGAGSSGMSLSSLGDTRTTAMTDPSKSGPNGDGSMSAADALGNRSGAADGAGVYAAGSGGGAGRSSERGLNPFSSLFGGDGNGAGNGSGSTTTEFRRDPASLAGRADASRNGLGPMGSQDPANYFSMLKVDDNLFKIVERRYESKSRQWAISDAQQIRRSVKP